MVEYIELRGARTHNLKGVDCSIPVGQLTVVSGVSGSGKSSLAFDTLYAEGQRRYTESLSTYARQFLQRMERPPVDAIVGVQPAVALRQTVESTNSRSTVGTISEIDDHLHLLFTHAGETTCPICDELVERDSASATANYLLEHEDGEKFICVAEVPVFEEEQRSAILRQLIQQGHRRYLLNGEILDLEDADTEAFLDEETYSVVIDRLAIKTRSRQRIGEAIEVALQVGGGRMLLYPAAEPDGLPLVFDRAFRCNTCGTEYVEPQPALFSFNTSLGACDRCAGFGKMIGLDFDRVVPQKSRSILDGAVEPFRGRAGRKHQKELVDGCRERGVPLDIAWRRLSTEQQRFIVNGGPEYRGLRAFFDELKYDTKAGSRITIAKYRGYSDCEMCLGSRVSQDALNVRFAELTIGDIWRMRLEEAREFFNDLELDENLERGVTIVLDEIKSRLAYLDDIGLGYLTLDRASRSLSGGEMQRIQLTTSIGRALTDTLYVLDEPTAGLHATDSERLLGVLKRLRDGGNTVVVVEHDPEIIRGADYVVELGPLGGENGGEVVFEGAYKKFKTSETLTRQSMDAPPVIGTPITKKGETIDIINATEHNLNELTVSIPTKRLVAVTGVSGSGKSTLMRDVLYNTWRHQNGYAGIRPGAVDAVDGFDNFDDVVMMDQSALGRSSRSNPMSYTKVYDDIRKLFASTNGAKVAGLTPGAFSFNSPGGRCETCAGLGVVTLEMHFLADLDVVCETCHGKRFTSKVLDIKFKEKSILDVFHMTVDDALDFFSGHRAVIRKLRTLNDVGLGYLRLGQSTSTLSGGEAQRLKLATFLREGQRGANTGSVLFIFDEPTVGLHLADIDTLYEAIRQLVDFGHSVIVIEHNIELIARCDHVIDLGPGGGPAGGEIVGEGTPAKLSGGETATGRALSAYLDG